jgi:ABC-type multidrug transport system permease subunit
MLFTGMASVAEGARTNTWRQRYQASRYHKEFVASRSGKRPHGDGKTGEEAPRRHFGITQWLALIKRNVFVKLRDRTQTAVLLLQAPLFALLVCLVIYPIKAAPQSSASFGDLAEKLPIVHFLMVIAAVWFGCNNAARDIVGEWTIYKRERMVTLKLMPYVFSKLTVLLGLCIFQCGALLGIVQLVCGLHGGFWSGFLVLLLASMIGTSLGLCLSAMSKTTESAIALLPVVLLPIIALGGGMRPIYQMHKIGQVISLAIPSRWAFEANLLREVGAHEWGDLKSVPDFSCTLQGGPTEPVVAAAPGQPAMPMPAAGAEVNSLNIMSDAAEVSIPRYTITARPPGGNQETCRASAKQVYATQKSTVHAVNNRHSFGTSITVLGSMFLLLTVGSIGILKKRDNEPQ